MLTLSARAQTAFRADEGRPLFHAGWRRTVFIHYEVDPAALQPQVPFPLDTRDGKAYVSLVAFTLSDLRFAAGGPPFHPRLPQRPRLHAPERDLLPRGVAPQSLLRAPRTPSLRITLPSGPARLRSPPRVGPAPRSR
ncbi:MAG: DUF2071 domain-containing protein [Planctomycetes bacterium]|nr:DUF2071 domain-containing protein [Planctomycetota bacterium]